MQAALEAALYGAHNYRSSVADWNALATSGDPQKESKAWLEAYRGYQQNAWGATLANLLGHNLAALAPLKILELGSGSYETFKNLTTGIKRSISYHSVDKKPSPALLSVDCHVHNIADVFVDTVELPKDYFNVLVVDIEPHGREIELLDRFEPCMQNEYTIILKCIGDMDVYGSGYADPPLNHLKSKNVLLDAFAVTDMELTRDVYAVCSRDACDFDGRIYNGLEWDSAYDSFRDRYFCVRPSHSCKRLLLYGLPSASSTR